MMNLCKLHDPYREAEWSLYSYYTLKRREEILKGINPVHVTVILTQVINVLLSERS